MSFTVMTCGGWRDLVQDEESYRCRLCGKAVSLGDTGKAISNPDGSYSYEH